MTEIGETAPFQETDPAVLDWVQKNMPTPAAKNGAQPDEARAQAQELLAVACEAHELEGYAAHVRGMISPGSQWPWIAPAILAIETAATEARAPDGWVLVPREPTEAMIEAGFTASFPRASGAVWLAMIAAVELAR